MPDETLTTWDGLPRANSSPFGATIIVYAQTDRGARFLLLRRSNVADDTAEWAWTPPAGARQPGEHIDDCAARELHEEIGITALPMASVHGTDDWPVYTFEADMNTPVTLDHEHTTYAWVRLEDVVARCLPDVVHHPVTAFAATLSAVS